MAFFPEPHFSHPLISWTPQGLHCLAGGFHIDPHRAVEIAIVTHAHSDHARRGSKKYICAESSVGLLRTRLGKSILVEGVPFGRPFRLGGVEVSLHPAGHILGSAQVRVESEGEVWVASGDYKRDPDPSCEPFESVSCDTFITEATFGTPKYRWDKSQNFGQDIFDWWETQAQQGLNSILFGYSLGKSQRILAELEPFAQRPVLIHASIEELTECYRSEGRRLAPTAKLDATLARSENALQGELVLAPPSIVNMDKIRLLEPFRTAFASGWMVAKTGRSSYGGDYDHGFVMSDHADWGDLNRTILETRAKRVFVQHRNGALIRHLRKQGIEAHCSSMLEPENYQRMGGINLRLFD